MLQARVIECAVNLAAINKANHTFRLRAGQLLVEPWPAVDANGPSPSQDMYRKGHVIFRSSPARL